MRNNYLLRKYGIDESQYSELLRQQGNCCAICKRPHTDFPRKLAIDHDHGTGLIRGVLCTYCNRYRVGRHTKAKSIGILRAVIEYLERPETGLVVPPKKKRKKHGRKKKTRSILPKQK